MNRAARKKADSLALAEQLRKYVSGGGEVQQIPVGANTHKDNMGVREQFDRIYKAKQENTRNNNGHTNG